ncbi:ejaculatory bulb-specific protein 3-like isoform X2 [Hyposmocoma kahamanoa]|uniref:ejaculatory bulb-specific protein 3-like isoform X2 n=1 Tax=Hyposmocoma kahamanoa TaxID=1477025 RepID=UPI000E6D9EF9|nr:ejaculatory bulb-specific protein 3-like isoform X2 [Hyposmocoma kahamanoa]
MVKKMNTLLVAVLALALPLAFCYDEIFDKIDLDKILGDDNLFNKYIDCLLDKGPCEPMEHAPEFRKLVPEVIAEACAKCSPIQKQHVRKTVNALKEKKPEAFQQFVEKYDPKGVYQEAFAAFMIAKD